MVDHPRPQHRTNLRYMSPGEVMFLIRFRLGKSQPEMAKHYDTHERRYWDIEMDRRAPPAYWRVPKRLKDATKGELCMLARRRFGIKKSVRLRGVAKLVGVSHVTLLRMESRSDARLVDYWRSKGYSF